MSGILIEQKNNCWSLRLFLLAVSIAVVAQTQGVNSVVGQEAKSFGEDLAFLKSHTAIVELASGNGAGRILVAPAWQGRVMTSTCGGSKGASFGWINYPLVEKGISPEDKREGLEKHIYVFGGEERLWLGPEGGQFSLFFPEGSKTYEFETWKTPAVLDTEPFDVVEKSGQSVSLRKKSHLTNTAGTKLEFQIDRTVSVLENDVVEKLLGTSIDKSLATVAFQSSNRLTNTGKVSWKAESGVPSIWLLGMLKPAADVVMAIPFQSEGSGTRVATDYFGPIKNDRLKVGEQIAYFKGDGKYRAKIGIPAARAKSVCGSYSPSQKTLTLIKFNLPGDAKDLPYVRSQWKHHEKPYAGDVVNCYNDGPPEPGAKPLGPFYELESSSPALALMPNGSYTHVQTTIHFTGSAKALDEISKSTLGVGLDEIVGAFK